MLSKGLLFVSLIVGREFIDFLHHGSCFCSQSVTLVFSWILSATFLLSLTDGCLHGPEGRTFTHKHSKTLLLKMGFHGEAGWESIKGNCLRTHVCVFVCVCMKIAQTVKVLYGVAALFFSEWRPCLSHRIGYYSNIELIVQILSCTQAPLS